MSETPNKPDDDIDGDTVSVMEDTGIACLVILLRFFAMAGNADQIRHQFSREGEPLDAGDLVRASRSLELKSRIVETTWDRLVKTPLPALVELNDGRFIILAKVAEDQALVQDPTQQGPQQFSREQLEDVWSGRLILVQRRAAFLGKGSKFDVSWFIPAVLRYRRIFGEVLIASFFLQLFGLITPLFFQVVIDKVLVHRGLTTLDVLVFGLIVVSLFEVLMGALRTYTFSHTTSRIDVELGAKLYRHL